MIEPRSNDELCQCVRDHDKVAIQGGCTKRRLVGDFEGRQIISTAKLTGVCDYKPDEYIFTAKAGTRLSEIRAMLAENGQYLPFDPPLVEEGATVGGAVAAGLNGPGSYRFGGLRDFILAVRFVDGTGRLVTGGGKVVKNAAGFDFPKLMVGSLGRLGALAEVTLKVFPQPEGVSHLRLRCSNLEAAVSAMNELAGQPWDLDALELLPGTSELKIRLRGEAGALEARRLRIGADVDETGRLFWEERDSLMLGKAGDYLAKVPITPDQILSVAGRFKDCVISIAGNLAWVSASSLEEIGALGIPALIVRGRAGEVVQGMRSASAVQAAIKQAFDPADRFPPSVMS
jgi:glycolate oxidase FAD binding subunit